MEAIVPMIAFSLMYTIFKQNKKESFTNNEPTKPLESSVQYDKSCKYSQPIHEMHNNTQLYQENHPGVKQYFQNQNLIPAGGTMKTMSGETIDTKDFVHNNQQPFFGSSVKQNSSNYGRSETILDNMNGNASQHNIKKETAPLFAPKANMNWTYGTPNSTDMMQQRMYSSNIQRNTKPFEEKRIAPGLCKNVLNENGELGYNSGLIARDSYMPKTIDDLTVNTKQTFEGRVLNGKSAITNRGVQGEIEKHHPDTYYINTPERYFTTTGVEKAPKARSKEILKAENRIFTTSENYGAPKTIQKPHTKGTYEEPNSSQM
jgi:hypothetical protein